MTTNLSNEALEQKLSAAIEEYNQVESNLRQSREQTENLEKALEQRRGRVTILDELLREQKQAQENMQSPNGEVELPEVVTGEVIEGTATEKK